MKITSQNSLDIINELNINNKKYLFFSLKQASKKLGFALNKLPYTLRIILEGILRNESKEINTVKTLKIFSDWLSSPTASKKEFGFMPSRILMQDYTGVPALVDLASMRDILAKIGDNPSKINPLIPVDLIIDHSVQVDVYGTDNALQQNTVLEIQRNKERYEFLRWGEKAFTNFRLVPPGVGICHQVNLEYIGKVVQINNVDGKEYIYPDTLVGLDSHTTMINGLGILGWGVGGIEAEAAMLGQMIPMILPEVIGVKLINSMKEGVNATDLVLTITKILREKSVVGKFVEFWGPAIDTLSLPDRATISNMAPEFGATCAYFPIDQETIKYLSLTGRSTNHIALVEHYAKEQQLWRNSSDHIIYSDIVEIDLNTVESSLAGPKNPQVRVSLNNVKYNFDQELLASNSNVIHTDIKSKFLVANQNFNLDHGDLVIAAITSCTNTSNPIVMIAAGLVAKKACLLGLKQKPWVKTSFAPGSSVVTEYLKIHKLDQYLNKLGFNLVGYGCTTCIGNSGPLKPEIEYAITKNNLIVAGILSGNRNFEGRIHPLVRANYLASPPLVVVYSLVGHIRIDLTTEPVGIDKNNNNVYLKDIWPTNMEINKMLLAITPQLFQSKYSKLLIGNSNWYDLKVDNSDTYPWKNDSTYIKNPPYFKNFTKQPNKFSNIKGARILAVFGNSITTDHISPAGSIKEDSPAGKYLIQKNIDSLSFNSYGSRRGNHEVMMRGAFSNPRIKNLLCPGTEGGVTKWYENGEQITIFDAATKYQQQNIPLVIFAGKEYGTGSSRDWAAKGPALLGVKAVIAESFERIHRSNLIGMGILPLILVNTTIQELNLTYSDLISITSNFERLIPYQNFKCIIKKQNDKEITIDLILQASTNNELEYITHGGILHKVIRDIQENKIN